MITTVSQLKAAILADVYPSGAPENLLTSIGNHFQEAFAEISQWVDCEQQNNANVIKFCNTNYKSGMSVIQAPVGRIVRVFTIANEDFSDPVFYRQTDWPEPEAWARNLYLFPKPLITDARKLPLGFQFSDAANDSAYGRARTGIWSIYKGNLFLAPWIQSNELVVIEWDGIKQLWSDGDPINPAVKYRQAIKLYVQFAYERDYGTEGRADRFKNRQHSGWFDEALEELMHECREQTKLRRAKDFPGLERNRLCTELLDDDPIDDASGVVLADLGNISSPGADLDAVANLTESWGVDAVLACGLISGSQLDYDLAVGSEFHSLLLPYIGNKGSGAIKKNLFWPVPSSTDWEKDSLASFLSFFPVTGRYYTVALGDIQIFVIDSASFEPDGTTVGSIQANWLQAQLALSTAPWKIVKMDGAPYGSIHNNPSLQWPFASWGAHLLICSQTRNYERLDVSGLPVINNGLGGVGPIEQIVTRDPNSKAVYSSGFGAGKIVGTSTQLAYELWSQGGDLIDSLILTK